MSNKSVKKVLKVGKNLVVSKIIPTFALEMKKQLTK